MRVNGVKPPEINALWVHVVLSVAGVLLAVLALWGAFGFTVDDAWITSRYAWNIARGQGHRFNGAGFMNGATDGVTPLWWPYVLAAFSPQSVLSAWQVARGIGVVAWLMAAVVLSRKLAQLANERVWPVVLSYLVAFGSPSVAAWASSGMETAVATALVTVAAVQFVGETKRIWPVVLLGVSCTLRPELGVYSLVLALGFGWKRAQELTSRWGDTDGDNHGTSGGLTLRQVGVIVWPVAIVLVFYAAVMVVRYAVFGHVGPLSLRAKPSDFSHGLMYVAASLLVGGAPVAMVSFDGWRKVSSEVKWLVFAFAGHCVACVLVGGDWMPMSRLFAPVIPQLALVYAYLALETRSWASVLRAVGCVVAFGFVWVRVGVSSASVTADRLRLVQQLSGMVATEQVVASVDIGWVGVAHSGPVLDLAGVTDPQIAAFSGGHTSKLIPVEYLDVRGVRYLLLLVHQAAVHEAVHGKHGKEVKVDDIRADRGALKQVWELCDFARVVERRLCNALQARGGYEVVGQVFSKDDLRYVVVRLM